MWAGARRRGRRHVPQNIAELAGELGLLRDCCRGWRQSLEDPATRSPSGIAQNVRSYDQVGRYGGEEFVAVLPACGTTDIEQSANRIRSAIASAPIPVGTSEIAVTVSIGATSRIAGSGCDEEMLQTADKALYQAKNAGRNRVFVL